MSHQSFATGEFAFFEIHEEAEARLQGRAVFGKIIAIERIAHFEAQRIA